MPRRPSDQLEHAEVRRLARQTFSRLSGAPLVGGNAVQLLIDGQANFAAWLAAIRGAQTSILFENYFFVDDALGREFVAALAERAAAVGEPWLSYFTPEALERKLRGVGFRSVEFLTPEAARADYLRDSGLPAPRRTTIVSAIR